jgi:hypothetical protein
VVAVAEGVLRPRGRSIAPEGVRMSHADIVERHDILHDLASSRGWR